MLLLIAITLLLESSHGQISNQDLSFVWQEDWFGHDQLLKFQASDDNIVLYYDDDMPPTITWPLDISSQVWAYVKRVYGDFGDDQRLYVILHGNKYLGGRHSTYFDETHDYRNVIDIGHYDTWVGSTGWNLDTIVHLIGFIVEGASRSVDGYPAFPIWRGGPWAEIFVYDVYKKLGWDAEAERWYNEKVVFAHDFPRVGTRWFLFWFYPIYNEYGETSVLASFFDILAANLPKIPFPLDNNYFQYNHTMNFGEFVHFWSGAAKAGLKGLALNAFGRKDEEGNDWIPQFEQAQRDFADIIYGFISYKSYIKDKFEISPNNCFVIS